MDWYYSAGDKQVGPVPDTVLAELIKAGTVTGQTLVWHEGMADWKPYGELQQARAAVLVAPAAAHQAACYECRKLFPQDEMLRHGNSWVCPACKPVFVQRLKEGVALKEGLVYGGFWIRVAAKILDSLIMLAVNFLIGLPLQFAERMSGEPTALFYVYFGITYILQLSASAGYTIFFLGRYGATPGKMVCKLKVVTPEGNKIGYGRACGRHFAEMLSAIFCIGYIMVAFDEEKRALHDRICNTRVVQC